MCIRDSLGTDSTPPYCAGSFEGIVTRNTICTVSKAKLTFTDKGKLRSGAGNDVISTLAKQLLASGRPIPEYWQKHVKNASGRRVDNNRLWEEAAAAALADEAMESGPATK